MLADEAKKAGKFQQAFGLLGDILDIGGGQIITQEQENKVSPCTPVDEPTAASAAALGAEALQGLDNTARTN